MILKRSCHINFIRVFVCGLLTTTIVCQVLSQAFEANFNLDYSVEWNDTSESSETDTNDLEQKEQKKDIKLFHFATSRTDYTTLSFSSYQIKKHPLVNIDIYLPPPKKDYT